MLLLVGLPNLVGVILKGGVDKFVSSSFYGASLAIQFLSPLPPLAEIGADLRVKNRTMEREEQ